MPKYARLPPREVIDPERIISTRIAPFTGGPGHRIEGKIRTRGADPENYEVEYHQIGPPIHDYDQAKAILEWFKGADADLWAFYRRWAESGGE